MGFETAPAPAAAPAAPAAFEMSASTPPAPPPTFPGFESAQVAPSAAAPTNAQGFEMLPESAPPADAGGLAMLDPIAPTTLTAPAAIASPSVPVAEIATRIAFISLEAAEPDVQVALRALAAPHLSSSVEIKAVSNTATRLGDLGRSLGAFELSPDPRVQSAQLELFPLEALSPTSGAVVVSGFEMPVAAVADVQVSIDAGGFEMLPEQALPPQSLAATSPTAGVVVVQGFEMLPAGDADAVAAEGPKGFEMLPEDPAAPK